MNQPHPHHKNITQEKDFHGILRWIDSKRQKAWISLIAAFVGSIVWMLVAAFFGMLYLSGFVNSFRGASRVFGSIDNQSHALTFLLLLGFQVALGFALYFSRRFNPKGAEGDTDWNKIHNSGINEAAASDSLILDRYYYGYGAGPAAHAFVFLLWLVLLFLGPGIFVNALIESQFILETRNPDMKNSAAIALLRLFRMCGEPIPIETLDIPSLDWGQKLLLLGKLQRMQWIYITKDLSNASLESGIDQNLQQFLGYR